jgi:hypothetical protein
MKCYITGGECTCGAFDVAGECPHESPPHEDEVTSAVFDMDDMIVEQQFAAMSHRIDGD